MYVDVDGVYEHALDYVTCRSKSKSNQGRAVFYGFEYVGINSSYHSYLKGMLMYGIG